MTFICQFAPDVSGSINEGLQLDFEGSIAFFLIIVKYYSHFVKFLCFK